jgi:aryl-alcohol dehydrogenase
MAQINRTDVLAAVLMESKGAFHLRPMQLDAARDDEVLVRVVATGMCHTDAVVRAGDMPTPLPVVLGHEGSGVVVSAGSAVRKVASGDHVVLTFRSCGRCGYCLSGAPAVCEHMYTLNFGGSRPDGSHALHCEGMDLNDQFFGQSSFATYALANERNTVKVQKDVPLELLGPLGCGIQTGAGAVLNSLRVVPGDSFAVFGSGAVGLAAVMAARLAGATTIIAVDIIPSRLELARAVGATHAVDSRETDPKAGILSITGVGVHYALDTTGRVEIIRIAVDSLRPGGTCGFLGASAPGAEIKIDANMMMATSKRLRGIVIGDSVPDTFIPRLIDLYRQGRFPFDRLVRYYALDQINQALKDSEVGVTIKPILRMP